MKKIMIIILLILVLSGCTTNSPIEKKLEDNLTQNSATTIIIQESNELDKNNKSNDKEKEIINQLEDNKSKEINSKVKLTAKEIYAQSKNSMYLIEVNCSYNVQFKNYSIRYKADWKSRNININEQEKYVFIPESTKQMGSGFLLNENLISNYHVIDCDAEKIKSVYQYYFESLIESYNKGYTLNRSMIEDFVSRIEYYQAIEDFKTFDKTEYGSRSPDEFYESWLTAVFAEYFLNNLDIKFTGREMVGLHESDDFTKEINLEFKKGGAVFPEKDFLVLKLNSNKNQLTSSEKNIDIGETIYIIGFPFSTIKDISQINDVNEIYNTMKESPVISSGIISSIKESSSGVPYYMLDAPTYKGGSGGPVLNEYGEVIGIAIAIHSEQESFTYVLPINNTY